MKYLLHTIILIIATTQSFAGVSVREVDALDFTSSVGKDLRDTAEHSRKRVIGLRRFILCVDGLKLLQTVGPSASGAWGSSGYNLNPALSTIQFYEERDGKSLPATCTSEQ